MPGSKAERAPELVHLWGQSSLFSFDLCRSVESRCMAFSLKRPIDRRTRKGSVSPVSARRQQKLAMSGLGTDLTSTLPAHEASWRSTKGRFACKVQTAKPAMLRCIWMVFSIQQQCTHGCRSIQSAIKHRLASVRLQ